MFPADVPVTPDHDEAQRWLEQELSRPEYSTELSPITRFIRVILQAIVDLLGGSGSGTRPPIEYIILAVVALLLIIGVFLTIFVRLRHRRVTSSTVFDDEDVSASLALKRLSAAKESGSWNDSFIWAFRLLVLTLAHMRILHDGPGLTAKEATEAAARRVPHLADRLRHQSEVFDAIRYGESTVSKRDVDDLETTATLVLDSLRAQLPQTAPAETGVSRP
ncbi:DUF4129 domain-containing protein [Schaalia sp. ZJ1691]|uniref:DUF4129 domain-containing protein n=1 Tax=Schaalia sp. ZJ1691 TaxID=2709404 RepID=UPI0013EB4B49|nr:DUF4129 domain-containing protein [Schaalia sp. ZJ1691]